RISRAWDRILEHAIASHEEMPPLRTGKRGRQKRRIGHNLALRLQKYKQGCLRFLTDPRTPFSNNEAERDLRMGKLRQKISGGFRSMQGARDFANLRSVIATARKQRWNVLETLAHPDPIQLIPVLRL
ncbi:MAG: transposase, partial [Alphaproteobacteria bacterium]|nr:transposase [Alphaproteobacteria bacterium]